MRFLGLEIGIEVDLAEDGDSISDSLGMIAIQDGKIALITQEKDILILS